MQNPFSNGIMNFLELCWIGQIQLKIKLPAVRAIFLLNALLKETLKEYNKHTSCFRKRWFKGSFTPLKLSSMWSWTGLSCVEHPWGLPSLKGRKGAHWHFRNEHTLSKQRLGQDRMLSILCNTQLLKETVFLIDFHQLHWACSSKIERKGYFGSNY